MAVLASTDCFRFLCTNICAGPAHDVPFISLLKQPLATIMEVSL